MLAVLWAALPARGADEAIKLTRDGTAIRVDVGGSAFTTYHFAGGQEGQWLRPRFDPLLAADGTAVTVDQKLVNEKDHAHHRSLWVGHSDVNGADHWEIKGKRPPRQNHVAVTVEGDTITHDVAWEGKDEKPVLRERRTMRFVAYADGARGVDLTVVLTPADGDVELGDSKEAGLCAVRAVPAIAKKPTLTNAAGASEKTIWGKPAKWCDVSGAIDGRPYGVAMLDHPTNPRHPATWHVRGYGLLAANIFGLSEFDKKLPKDAGKMVIRKGESASFRYRVIIHAGDARAAKLDEKWAEFAK